MEGDENLTPLARKPQPHCSRVTKDRSDSEPLTLLKMSNSNLPGIEKQWPADHVERHPLSSLIPYARNARTHTDEQVAQIAASIREWGWTIPILIDDDGGIIAGHCRVLAAQRLGIDNVPVMVAAGWSEAQKRAYVIADNKLTLNSGWDNDLLRIELDGLNELGFDLEITGFALGEIADLFGDEQHGGSGGPSGGGSLATRFMVPPFSVLNAREGWWQDRKRAWVALGIQSELGRGAPIGGSPLPSDRQKNATPGGSPLPSAKLKDGRTVRGDGKGRPLASADHS